MRKIKLFPHQIDALEQTKGKGHVAVPGYEGLCEIDEYGNIYSIITTNSRRKGIIKPFINSSGYLRINLYDATGKAKKHYVYHLVAIAFITSQDNLPVVNHIDGNKLNNHVSNLEWLSQKQNVKHSFETGLEHRPMLTEVDGILYPNMKSASIGVFGNAFLIGGHRRRKGNQFSHLGHIVRVGDAICQR